MNRWRKYHPHVRRFRLEQCGVRPYVLPQIREKLCAGQGREAGTVDPIVTWEKIPQLVNDLEGDFLSLTVTIQPKHQAVPVRGCLGSTA